MAMASLFKSWKLASYTNQGFFFLLKSQLLNNLPIYHSKFGLERDFIHILVHNGRNNQFCKIPKLKKKVFGINSYS